MVSKVKYVRLFCELLSRRTTAGNFITVVHLFLSPVCSYLGRRPRQPLHLPTLAIVQINKHPRDPPLVMLPLPKEIMAPQIPAVDKVGCWRSGMCEVILDHLRSLQGVIFL